MLRLFKYALRRKRLYLFSFLGLFSAVTADAFLPKVTQLIIDDVFVSGDSGMLMRYLFLILLLSSVMALGYYVQEYCSDRMSSFSQKGMRRDLFSHIQKMDMGFFSKNSPGELMSRTKQDVENVGFVFGFVGVFTVEILFHTFIFLYMLVKINIYGVIVPAIIMPIIFFIAFFAEKKGDAVYDEISDETADMNEDASEVLGGIRTVKAFGREEYEQIRFERHNRRFFRLNLNVDFLWADTMSPMSALARAMQILSVFSSGILVIRGNMSLGEAAAVTLYVSNLAWPMMDLGWVLQAISTANASARKLLDIFDNESVIKDGNTSRIDLSGPLIFDDVCFEKEGKKILDGISFTLEKGRTLGIMGATGSGKSTICSLLTRFADPSSGKITYSGIPISEMKLSVLRKLTAMVGQDTFLFSDRIDENVKIGEKDTMSDDAVISALKSACALDFVNRLSEKEATVIGEKGVGLSGGQKQRISIARAFAKNAPLLVLDDATSSLDMETEKKIQKSVKALSKCSKIIIAHRISAVRHADEIIYLENGRIAERGSHESLMEANGLYRRTYEAQYGRTM